MTHPTAYDAIARDVGASLKWDIAEFCHKLSSNPMPILSLGAPAEIAMGAAEETVYVRLVHPERVREIPFDIAERTDIVNIKGQPASMRLKGTFLEWNEGDHATTIRMNFTVYKW